MTPKHPLSKLSFAVLVGGLMTVTACAAVSFWAAPRSLRISPLNSCASIKPGMRVAELEHRLWKQQSVRSIDYSEREIDVVIGDSVCVIAVENSAVIHVETRPSPINY